MSIIKQNPVITDTINDNNLISYKFNVPTQNSSSGTYATVLYANQSVIFEGKDFLKNIIEWISLDDEITGDVAFFRVLKDFRYSLTGYDFSPWFPLSITNLKNIGANEQVTIQFRYSAIASQQNYNLVLPIKKPDNAGWYNIIPKTSTTPYIVDKDYPQEGNLKWTIGYGTNGQFHLDTSTSKFYQKNNGNWGAGIFVVRSETSGYIPTQIFGHPLSDAFVDTITSRFPLVPINDYELTNDLRFGKTFDSSINSNVYRPQQGDKMFINPLTQGINFKGLEEIRAYYDYPVLPPSYTPRIYVKQLDITAKRWINIISSEPLFCLTNVGDQAIFKPPFTLKLYSIDSFSVEVDGICSTSWNACLDIKFRYSFNSRNWDTQWMPLTLANLKCIKGNPLKFFYIEFLFTKICDNNGNPICVSDIVINGNIQNVSKDYDKINRFGLRSDCNYGDNSSSGTYNPSTGQCADTGQCAPNTIIPHDWITDLNSCGVTTGTFNPYDTTQVLALNEKTANDVSNLFGWEVDYYKTEANDAGIDYVLHEYGTYDTVNKQKLKILVPDNKFPEDQVAFNMFDLALFDSFEIHITRREFYSKFGIGVRPAQEDFLFICQINKWFKVEHAQSYRDFLNSSIYYKVTLGKKQDDTHIDNREYTDSFNNMIENNQLDNLFGKQVKEDIKHVVNDPLLQNLTEIDAVDVKFKYDNDVEILVNAGVSKEEILDYKKPDPIELKIMVQSKEYDLENATNVIATNIYDLTSRVGDTAVIYQKLDTDICDCCNRAFTVWFNVYKYQAGMVYNLIDNYDNATNQGYKIDFIDGRLEIIWFGQLFDIDVSVSPMKWYGLVVNFNQKQHKLEVNLYKRRTENNCTTTDLDLVNEEIFDLVPVSYKGDLVLKLKGSYLYWTNMRIFNEIIPKSQHFLVLNQYVVKNTEYLIVGDNADRKVIAPHWKF